MRKSLPFFPENTIHPIIRIKKISLINFKNVQHGEITFPCGSDDAEFSSHSNILGIYGQNGSGKTAVIDALGILGRAMSGLTIFTTYTQCIMAGAEYSQLEFTFDFQYPEPKSINRTIVYEFKIASIPNELKSDEILNESDIIREPEERVKIYDEIIYGSGPFDGEKLKKQILITSRDSASAAFGPVRKINNFVFDYNSQIAMELFAHKSFAQKVSFSPIFGTLKFFCEHSNYSEYYLVLAELFRYAISYLRVVDTSTSSIKRFASIIINSPKGMFLVKLTSENIISSTEFDRLTDVINGINVVLPEIISEMKLVVRETVEPYMENGVEKHKFNIFSERDGRTIPLSSESAGIVKLVGILSLYIFAFNNPSCTIAIDELDAGIHEYLLGELLTIMDEYGKGQFIFTSHNLRPLEVLDKSSLVFTTANPNNRYVHIKGVGKTNNLRDMYLREIMNNNQEELMYDSAKKYKIVAALKKAGLTSAKK